MRARTASASNVNQVENNEEGINEEEDNQTADI